MVCSEAGCALTSCAPRVSSSSRIYMAWHDVCEISRGYVHIDSILARIPYTRDVSFVISDLINL